MSVQSDLDARLQQIPGVMRRAGSRWGDSPSYAVGGREIAHFHADGSLDIRLTRQVIRQMKSERT